MIMVTITTPVVDVNAKRWPWRLIIIAGMPEPGLSLQLYMQFETPCRNTGHPNPVVRIYFSVTSASLVAKTMRLLT